MQVRHCMSTMMLCSLWKTGMGFRKLRGAGRERTLWKLDDLGLASILCTMSQVRTVWNYTFCYQMLIYCTTYFLMGNQSLETKNTLCEEFSCQNVFCITGCTFFAIPVRLNSYKDILWMTNLSCTSESNQKNMTRNSSDDKKALLKFPSNTSY